MTKILMINLPAHGHVNPTLALAKELCNRGCHVSYLISEEFKEEIEATGASMISYSNKIRNISSSENLISFIPVIYEMALEIGNDYDCIIYEMIFYVGKKLGDLLNKPTIQLISTFALNENMLKLVPKNISESSGFGGYLKKCFVDAPELNLVYTSHEFQPCSDQFDMDKFKFVGPSIIKRITKNTIPFDKLKRKIIYISLGTIINISSDFFQICLAAFSDMKVTVIMSVGKNVDIKRLGIIPDNFLVYNSVSQLDVLEHTDVFITHSGMNSVHESIYYGVPIIAIPQCADQPVVAKRLEELGLGKIIDKSHVSVNALKDTVNEILLNPIYKENLIKMRNSMINAGGYRVSADEILAYVNRKLKQLKN